MSRRLLLGADRGTVVLPPVDPEPLPPLPANLNLVFDGNSISNGYPTGQTLAWYVEEALGTTNANGATFTSKAVDGQTWVDMTTTHTDVDGAWSPAKTNVLIAADDTNDVTRMVSTATIIQDARDYFAAVKAVHPWHVLMWGNIPQSVYISGSGGTSAEQIALKNQRLIEVNDYWADNWQTEGLVGWVDMRTGLPVFDHDASSYSYFSNYAAGWAESDPLFTIHPAAGTLGGNIGLRVIARRIAEALQRVDWDALF